MNYAIVFGGGVGSRMQRAIPKQFIEVNGTPIIIHTLKHFQDHPEIDRIIVVCIESYLEKMNELLSIFGITKCINVVKGGKTGQESIYFGLKAIEKIATDNDIVILHDAVRPIIDAELISKNIACAQEKGNAISCSLATETICVADRNTKNIQEIIPRDSCVLGRAPQTFKYGDIFSCHTKANAEGYTTAIDSASMLEHYGYKLSYVQCSHFNIKITTPNDLYLFESYLNNC